MLTPNGLDVSFRVSRMASRNASGLGWVSAVKIPKGASHIDVSVNNASFLDLPSPPALETAAASTGSPTL